LAVVIVHQGAGLTRESYQEAVRRVTGGKAQLESAADWPAEGLLVHTAGEAEGGFRIVDVWESEEAVQRFGETLMPVLEELGITAPLEVYPAETFVTA
jgi:hypothetical protein